MSSGVVGQSLLGAVRQHDPSVSQAGLLRLEFESEEAMEYPIVWVTAQTLLYIWGERLAGRVGDLIVTRTLLEARVNLLRETRFSNSHASIKEILE